MEKTASHKLRLPSEERKASIVQAAIKLFAERGFQGTTTRELAAAVGVSEPILYEHFRTKRDLYGAIIETAARSGEGHIETLKQKYMGKDDDAGFFQELAAMVFRWHTEEADFVRLLLFSNLENHELKELFQNKSALIVRMVSEYISSRIETGAMRKVNPQTAARAFLGMIGNYALYEKVFRCPELSKSDEDVAKEMVGIFLGGLCKQGDA